MADFLIMATDKSHSDPIKDKRGCYKRGDIVEVFEHGKLQPPPVGSPFMLVRVVGITKAQADKYMAASRDTLNPNILIKRRIYNIDWTLLSPTMVSWLKSTRFVEVTLAQAKQYIRNKSTGVFD